VTHGFVGVLGLIQLNLNTLPLLRSQSKISADSSEDDANKSVDFFSYILVYS
jgi:hypothetical protein